MGNTRLGTGVGSPSEFGILEGTYARRFFTPVIGRHRWLSVIGSDCLAYTLRGSEFKRLRLVNSVRL